MEVSGQLHVPAVLSPGNNTGTYCTGGCLGPRVGLDGFGEVYNLLPLLGLEPWNVQSVASRYRPLVTRTSSKSGEEWLQSAVHDTEYRLR